MARLRGAAATPTIEVSLRRCDCEHFLQSEWRLRAPSRSGPTAPNAFPRFIRVLRPRDDRTLNQVSPPRAPGLFVACTLTTRQHRGEGPECRVCQSGCCQQELASHPRPPPQDARRLLSRPHCEADRRGPTTPAAEGHPLHPSRGECPGAWPSLPATQRDHPDRRSYSKATMPPETECLTRGGSPRQRRSSVATCFDADWRHKLLFHITLRQVNGAVSNVAGCSCIYHPLASPGPYRE